MKAIQYSETVHGAPIWMHDQYAHFNLLPNGARLKASTVPAGLNGTVLSGNVVGRIAGALKYSLIPATATALTSTNATSLTVAALAGATTITVADADGYAAGQAITVNGEARTVDSVDLDNNTITLTAGLTGAAAIGAAVVLATAAALTEVFLMATNIANVADNDNFTIYRHQRAVYQNFLPNWATMTAFLKGQLQTRYVMFDNIV